MSIVTRLKHGFNAFFNKDPTPTYNNNSYDYGGYFDQPYRAFTSRSSEKSVVGSIFNRLAVDVASLEYRHAQKNDNDQFVGTIEGELNDRFTISANEDQTGTQMIFDCAMTMFENGSAAIVPINTDKNYWTNDTFEVWEARVGYVTKWRPHEVVVKVYNGETGRQQEARFPKSAACLIQNPFYATMNEPNSNLKRLISKMNLLDAIDAQSASTKMNLLIQLPYTVRSKLREDQANKRVKSLEDQLTNSKYGIAYTDATEKITQLGRPIESSLPEEVKNLTDRVYSQFGLTQEIMNGTADEAAMLNYFTRTIEPIASAITEEVTRKWLSKNARTRKQAVVFYRDPFKLVPLSSIAEIANTLISSEVVSANEVRALIGLKPSSDPRADQLLNPNINPANQESLDLSLSQDNPEDGEYTDEAVEDDNEEEYEQPRDEQTAEFMEKLKQFL